MAKVNGIQLKAVKTFKGHEWEECYQGKLYMSSKGKKTSKMVAEWSQDSWGGVLDNVYMETGLSERKLREIIHEKNISKDLSKISTISGDAYIIQYELEELMTDLLVLTEREKTFKQAIKKGYKGIITFSVAHGTIERTYSVPQRYLEMSLDELRKEFADDIKELDKYRHGEEVECNVYKDLADFEIGEEIYIEDIAA